MRTTTLLAASLLGVALLTAPTAIAAGETCRGEAATIVGTGPNVQGTDGRDVIVTGPGVHISAGAGDDVICVTGGANFNIYQVDAGAGNDVVDSTAVAASDLVHARLGDGADTFVGGGGFDSVFAGPAPGSFLDPGSEAERDVIDTGDGSDTVASGGPGLANNDEVRTGNGDDDVTWAGTMGAQGVLDAGAGVDMLDARASGQNFGIDMTAQKLSRNGSPEASFSSFEELRVAPEPGLGSVDILGTDGDDVVELHSPATVRADLRGGDDQFQLAAALTGSRIDLGTGTDRLSTRAREGSVDLDLATGTVAVNGGAYTEVAGVENAYVSAMAATVIGNDRANTVFVAGCRATIDGGGGKDDIEHTNFDFLIDEGYSCANGDRITLRGGPGNDVIDGGRRADRIYGGGGKDWIHTGPAIHGKNEARGGPGNDKLRGGGDRDVLFGGAGNDSIVGSTGRDTALGGPDRDRCRAEVEKSCER